MEQEFTLSSPPTPVEPAFTEATVHHRQPAENRPKNTAIQLHGHPLKPHQGKEVPNSHGLYFLCKMGEMSREKEVELGRQRKKRLKENGGEGEISWPELEIHP